MIDRPRAARFRLSLRALMILVLVVGGILGWKAKRAQEQRRAVEAIKARKGSILYDFQYTEYAGSGVGLSNRKEPAVPRWIRRWVGDEYFQEVTAVSVADPFSDDLIPVLEKFDHLVLLGLRGPKVDDRVLARIAKFPRLQSLSLSQSTVTGAESGGFAGMTCLRKLAMNTAPELTDEGVSSLAGLSDLRCLQIMVAPKLTDLSMKKLEPAFANLDRLILHKTGISEDGLVGLRGCRKLTGISTDVGFTDLGLSRIRHLNSLNTLVLYRSDVSDGGLTALRGLKNLQSMVLSGSKISGPGLANLEGLASLKNLGLTESRLSDEGLVQVGKLSGLTTVNIQGTAVSPGAIAALQAARPTLKILSGPVRPPLAPAPPPASPTPKGGP